MGGEQRSAFGGFRMSRGWTAAVCLVVTAALVMGQPAFAQVPDELDLPEVKVVVDGVDVLVLPDVGGSEIPALPGGDGGLPALPDGDGELPTLPTLPPEVQEAINEVQVIVVPILVDAAEQAQPVSNAGGFALRMPCAGAGTAIVLVALLGGGLPFSVGFLSMPLMIFCAGAFAPGPVDPVFETVDAEAGPQLQEAAEPVVQELRNALEPVRPELAEVCAAIGLMGTVPHQVPPPLTRFDLTRVVC